MKNLKETKNVKRRKIRVTDRFWALMVLLLGIVSVFIFKGINETDMTGPVFMIIFGLYTYICTFKED